MLVPKHLTTLPILTSHISSFTPHVTRFSSTSRFRSTFASASSIPTTSGGATKNSSSTTASLSIPRRRRQSLSRSDLNADLVAPPDPVSNIRPVIYASSSRFNQRNRSSNSPYSISEFPSYSSLPSSPSSSSPCSSTSITSSLSSSQARLYALELRWKMHRERVDMINHRFWTTNNVNFNAQLEDRLSHLPPLSANATEQEINAREVVITKFYRDWQLANRARQTKWIKDWWRDVWVGIKLHTQVLIARATTRRGSRLTG